ncbi:MAG: cytidylate kinase-like family protein [Oscillospiraceae bacterium]|nr:cytidylate kinase-like family protein [Oscillospiraceae bacterium]
MCKYKIIAIERQYASGGRSIGKKVAKALGIPYYGREILEIAAKRNGQTPEYIEHLEETASTSMFYSLMNAYNRVAHGEANVLSPEEMLLLTETEVINDLANEGPCVMIGRSAGCILKYREDVLRVFIYADDEVRMQRAVDAYGDDPKEVAAILRQYDKQRSNFYNFNYNLDWGDKAGYHLCLDSGKLGYENCVSIITHMFHESK